jgi:hypothetical protein
MYGHNVTVNVNVMKQVNRILEIFFRVRLGIYRDLNTADSAYIIKFDFMLHVLQKKLIYNFCATKPRD